jgi:hypothetical protein
MPFDGVPGSLLIRPGGAIPQGWPAFDPSHPINAGLANCWPMAEGGGDTLYDLGPRTQPAAPNGSPMWTPTQKGRAIDASSGNYWTTASATYSASNNFTILLTACLLGTIAGAQGLLTIRNTSTFQPWGGLAISGAAEEPYLTGVTFNNSASEYNAHTALDIIQGLPFAAAVVATPTAMHVWMWDAKRGLRTFVLSESVTAGAVTGQLFIGADVYDPSGRYWPGWLLAPRVYDNRALGIADFLSYARDPRVGLVFPSDRLPLWPTATGGGGIGVSAAAALGGEALAEAAAAAALAAEATATSGRASRLLGETQATLAAIAGNSPALEFLASATAVAATPGEALAALAAGAVVAVENGGVLSLIVSAGVALPFEWRAFEAAPIVSAARLLASGGRIRILASPGRRRLLASPGRVRILQITDR